MTVLILKNLLAKFAMDFVYDASFYKIYRLDVY